MINMTYNVMLQLTRKNLNHICDIITKKPPHNLKQVIWSELRFGYKRTRAHNKKAGGRAFM